MGTDSLIEELQEKYQHLGVLLNFIEVGYDLSENRLHRFQEALQIMSDIVEEIKDAE